MPKDRWKVLHRQENVWSGGAQRKGLKENGEGDVQRKVLKENGEAVIKTDLKRSRLKTGRKFWRKRLQAGTLQTAQNVLKKIQRTLDDARGENETSENRRIIRPNVFGAKD